MPPKWLCSACGFEARFDDLVDVELENYSFALEFVLEEKRPHDEKDLESLCFICPKCGNLEVW